MFERLYCNEGDGEGENLTMANMVDELSEWDSFFERFKKPTKSEMRYDRVAFKAWMAKNFPAIEKHSPANYPTWYGLKRKRDDPAGSDKD